MLQTDAACGVVSNAPAVAGCTTSQIARAGLGTDCKNLRPGLGRALSPDTMELAAICFRLLQQQ